jgi:hypothetical protein
MAALTTQNIGTGGAITVAATAGGGDTIEVGVLPEGMVPVADVPLRDGRRDRHTITVAGVPFGPFTNQTVTIPVNVGTTRGARSVSLVAFTA